MSINTPISMALTLHGDATVQARSNAVAQSISSMGSAYRNFNKYARHAQYAMRGVNFLTGGAIGAFTSQVVGQQKEIESSLGRILNQLGFIFGGGLAHNFVNKLMERASQVASDTASRTASDIASRTTQDMMSSSIVRQSSMSKGTAAAVTGVKTKSILSSLGTFAALAGKFILTSAAVVAAAYMIGEIAGRIGDNITQGISDLATGGQTQVSRLSDVDLNIMSRREIDDYLRRERERFMTAAESSRWLPTIILDNRISAQEQQFREFRSEIMQRLEKGEEELVKNQQQIARQIQYQGRI